MKIEYSKNVDALYIRLREAKIADSKDIEEGVTVDILVKIGSLRLTHPYTT